jgi:hypothetical protein
MSVDRSVDIDTHRQTFNWASEFHLTLWSLTSSLLAIGRCQPAASLAHGPLSRTYRDTSHITEAAETLGTAKKIYMKLLFWIILELHCTT